MEHNRQILESTPQQLRNERRVLIKRIVNDFKLNESCEITTDNIASWRTSFYNYLTQYNVHQIEIKKFSISKKDKEIYIVCREF